MEPGQNIPTPNNTGSDSFGRQSVPDAGQASGSADGLSPQVHPWTPPSEASPTPEANTNGDASAGAGDAGSQAPFSAPFGGDASNGATSQANVPAHSQPVAPSQDMMGATLSGGTDTSFGQPQPNPAAGMSPTPMPGGDAMQPAQAPMPSQPAAAPKIAAKRGNFILLVVVAAVLIAAIVYLMFLK